MNVEKECGCNEMIQGPKKRKLSEEFKETGIKKMTLSNEDNLYTDSSKCVRTLVAEWNKSEMKAKIEKSQLPSIVLFPVLDDEWTKPVKTELMFVGKIVARKETSRLIKEFSAVWPLEGKSHLKRVRWTSVKNVSEILIRPVGSEENVNCSDVLPLQYVIGCNSTINTSGLMGSVAVHKVPKYPAMTNKQYEECMELWPVQYREDKYIEKVLDDKLFSLEEKAVMSSLMKFAIDVAAYGDVKVGCVVVDPCSLQVIAIAHDCRHSHPIQHAVIVAIDLVARSQGGGSWNISSKYVYHKPFNKEECEIDQDEFKKNNWKDTSKLCLPYLCTGYDLYVTREPCIMCAMALVHSRIRRVFYGHRSACGALGTKHKLHLQQGLNHHYEVWGGLLEKECYNLCPD